MWLFFTLLPVIVPAIVAFRARKSSSAVRVVFAIVAIITGLYVLANFFAPDTGENSPMGSLLLPIATIALGTWLAFTGVCTVAVLQYAVKGQLKSSGSIAAMFLIAVAAVLAVIYLFPFLGMPFRAGTGS